MYLTPHSVLLKISILKMFYEYLKIHHANEFSGNTNEQSTIKAVRKKFSSVNNRAKRIYDLNINSSQDCEGDDVIF